MEIPTAPHRWKGLLRPTFIKLMEFIASRKELQNIQANYITYPFRFVGIKIADIF